MSENAEWESDTVVKLREVDELFRDEVKSHDLTKDRLETAQMKIRTLEWLVEKLLDRIQE